MSADGLPDPIAPMLASAGSMPADQGGWSFEVKWDGVRAIVRSSPTAFELRSRSGNEITAGYPELAGLQAALGHHRAVLDSEIIAFDDDGRPSFQALQQRMHVRGPELASLVERRPVTLMAFDLLWFDGASLIDRSYDERRAALLALDVDGPHWQTPAAHPGVGDALLAATAEQRLEGVIAKRRDGPYRPGRRSDDWLKIKHQLRQELVVGGWWPGKGRRRGTIGSLQVGAHDPDGRLRYAGGVGTGFDDATLDRLHATLTARERSDSPFTGRQPPRGTRFADPTMVVEVRFAGWTADGSIRQAAYLGERDDKDPGEVVREDAPEGVDDLAARIPSHGDATIDVDGHEVALTNLDKPYYPTGWTKADVLRYYAAIAPVLLPHLRDRPVTLKRFPDGVDGPSFFQKHASPHRPAWVRTTTVRHGADKDPVEYVLIQDRPTLLWAAQLAAIELHPSLSRADARHATGENGRPPTPTALIFDLDPGPGTTIVDCCRVATEIRSLLDDLGVLLHAKTSGSKGLQLYAPLATDTGYERSGPFAHAVASLLEERHPERIVSRMRKALRDDRVLIDWSQNSAHKTTVCAYSLRARDRPTVSTPVTWDEVERCLASNDPNDLTFTANDVLSRVRRDGDLFAPTLAPGAELPSLGG